MTMIYSWEKQYNPWDTEPDVFDYVLEEEMENAKAADEISIEDVDTDSEIEFDEEFDL
jgi:hypothetical protein